MNTLETTLKEIKQKTKKPNILLILTLLICTIITGSLAFTLGNTEIEEKTAQIQLINGSDCTNNPYITATIEDPNRAQLEFTLFPSEQNTPQPATYYTDLLQIINQQTKPYNLSITITEVTGVENLGRLDIFLLKEQTDNPFTSNSSPVISLTSNSIGTISAKEPVTIESNSIIYVEIVGY
ncbi:MAG: hypothetical protein QM398_08620, partial [Thermoproteota archaeon]|nr:hypothetical protein [Thermoproteota archaeon]